MNLKVDLATWLKPYATEGEANLVSLRGGKWMIPDAKYREFLKLYAYALKSGEDMFFVERKRSNSSLLIDIDGCGDDILTVAEIVLRNAYTILIAEHQDPEAEIEATITCQMRNDGRGMHFLINNLYRPKQWQQQTLKKLQEMCAEAEPDYDWKKIIDPAMVTNGFRMLGSKKWDHKNKQVINTWYEPIDWEPGQEVVKRAICQQDLENNSSWLNSNGPINDARSAGHAPIGDGRDAPARAAAPPTTDAMSHTTEQYVNAAGGFVSDDNTRLLDMLKMHRCEDYAEWLKVAMAVKSEQDGLFYPEFDNWSRRSAKYDSTKNYKLWYGLKPKDNGITIGSLLWCAKQDEPENYAAWKASRVKKEAILRSYNDVKADFEERHFKVMAPISFGVVEDGRLMFVKKQELTDMYYNMYYCSEQDNKKPEKQRFITRWLGDEEMRTYSRVDFMPQGAPASVYNLYSGLRAEHLPAIPDEDVPELVAPFLRHIHEVLADGQEEVSKYIIQWLAAIVQGRKPQVMLIVNGREGVGKSLVFDFLRKKVFGDHITFQTAKPAHDLFSQFATQHRNRLLIQCDEGGADFHLVSEDLKNFITCDTIAYESKGKDRITVQNFASLVLTTNNGNPVKVNGTESRRICAMRASDRYIQDPAYFAPLVEALDSDSCARAVYQLLKNEDISEIRDFQAKRPITDFQRELMQVNAPLPMRYLKHLCEMHPNMEGYKSGRFFEGYKEWAQKINVKDCGTETSFGRVIKVVPGIEKKRSNGVKYVINTKLVAEFLTEKGWAPEDIPADVYPDTDSDNSDDD